MLTLQPCPCNAPALRPAQVLDSFDALPNSDPRYIEFQVGTDAGFEPKRGLKLAMSLIVPGLKINEVCWGRSALN